MNKACVYARYSSSRQDEASIDAQVRACRDYANANGLCILRVYADEAQSGKGENTARRKEYLRMLHDVDMGMYDTILIHKYDRVARNLREHANLDKRLADHNTRLVAVAQDVGTSMESKMVRGILWVLSEYYSDNLSSEVKKGHKETALKALHNGGIPPFGYNIENQKYTINENEAIWVRKMFRCAIDRVGFTDLIREMDAAGVVGKRGRPIRYSQIYEILRNEKYTGVYLWVPEPAKTRDAQRSKEGAIRIEGGIPAIVTPEQFQEVQIIMSKRKQIGKTKTAYLCSGLVYCGRCGAPMHGGVSTRRGHTYRRFSCSKHCGMPTIRAEVVDRAAIDYLRGLTSSESLKALQAAMAAYNKESDVIKKDFERNIQAKIAQKRMQLDGLMENLCVPGLPETIVRDIAAKMEALKNDIEVLENAEPPKDYTVRDLQQWIQAICEAPDERAIHLLIKRLVVSVSDDKKETSVSVESTVTEVARKIGSGSLLHIFPAIIFGTHKTFHPP